MPRNWSWGKKRKSGYRSGAEEKLADWFTERGIGFKYESETLKYEKPVRGALCKNCDNKKIIKMATYTPDFILDNGVIIEYKGRLTASDRAKYLAVQRSNPERPLHFVFGSDNKLSKSSTTRYSDWAESNGFDFSIGSPKPEWLVPGVRGAEG